MKNILHSHIAPKYFLLLALLLVFAGASAVDEFPARPEPPRLVNDFAGILSGAQAASLENKLDAFNRRTSTQIAIVIVKDIFGYEKCDYTFKLPEKWGIGQNGKNNGILILVSPNQAMERPEKYLLPLDMV